MSIAAEICENCGGYVGWEPDHLACYCWRCPHCMELAYACECHCACHRDERGIEGYDDEEDEAEGGTWTYYLPELEPEL